MGKQHSEITSEVRDFVKKQRIFFVGTAAGDGRVNVSPKGIDTIRIVSRNRVLWLNLTGSGNETAAHLLENPRMTIMFCSFEEQPLIVRFYGQAKAIHPRDQEWNTSISLFPPTPGARQVIDMEIDLVRTSCGMGVPCFEFRGERNSLQKWAGKLGEEGLLRYWRERNRVSIDGKPTRILDP